VWALQTRLLLSRGFLLVAPTGFERRYRLERKVQAFPQLSKSAAFQAESRAGIGFSSVLRSGPIAPIRIAFHPFSP
jgi:hypothetical protein